MRILAIAAIAGLGLAALAGPAMARPWADPEGRLTLNTPSGYLEQEEVRQGGDFTYAEFYTPNRDCSFIAMPEPGLSAIDAQRVRQVVQEDARFTETYLLSAANSFARIFPNDSAVLVSQSLDTSGFWPMRRVEYSVTYADGNARSYPAGVTKVYAAIQWRPGLQLWAMCSAYDGDDTAGEYDAFFRSVSHPNDAVWQAEVEAAEAAAAAAAPAE